MMVIMTVNSWSLEEDHFINFRRLAWTSSVSDPGLGTRVPVRKPSSAVFSTLTGVRIPDAGMMTMQCHHRGRDRQQEAGVRESRWGPCRATDVKTTSLSPDLLSPF